MFRTILALLVLLTIGCGPADTGDRRITSVGEPASPDFSVAEERRMSLDQISLILGVPAYPKSVQEKGLDELFRTQMEDGDHVGTRFVTEAKPQEVLDFYSKHISSTTKSRVQVDDLDEKFQTIGSHWETIITGKNKSGEKTILLVPEVKKGPSLTYGITTVKVSTKPDVATDESS